MPHLTEQQWAEQGRLFEEWATRLGHDVSKDDFGDYYAVTHGLWEAWHACYLQVLISQKRCIR